MSKSEDFAKEAIKWMLMGGHPWDAVQHHFNVEHKLVLEWYFKYKDEVYLEHYDEIEEASDRRYKRCMEILAGEPERRLSKKVVSINYKDLFEKQHN